MTDDDLARLGGERSLIFQNIANGVPLEMVMETFRRSEAEIMRELRFVASKIREYRFRRGLPPVDADDIKAIRYNRRPLLETLLKLGPRYLSSELILPNIGVQKLDHPAMVRESAERAGIRVIK